MLKYPSKVTPLKPSSNDIRVLAQLVEQRRLLVEDKRRYVNRLIDALKQYYPQPLAWLSHCDSGLFFNFISKWPSLQSLKRARENTIRKFFLSHGGNAVSLTDQRIEAIKNAVPLTEDKAVILPYSLFVETLIEQLKTVIVAIKTYNEKNIYVIYRYARC